VAALNYILRRTRTSRAAELDCEAHTAEITWKKRVRCCIWVTCSLALAFRLWRSLAIISRQPVPGAIWAKATGTARIEGRGRAAPIALFNVECGVLEFG
jgi:hypothetical protein